MTTDVGVMWAQCWTKRSQKTRQKCPWYTLHYPQPWNSSPLSAVSIWAHPGRLIWFCPPRLGTLWMVPIWSNMWLDVFSRIEEISQRLADLMWCPHLSLPTLSFNNKIFLPSGQWAGLLGANGTETFHWVRQGWFPSQVNWGGEPSCKNHHQLLRTENAFSRSYSDWSISLLFLSLFVAHRITGSGGGFC